MVPLEEALSVQLSAGEIHTLSVVLLIVSILSALGAGWIILSFTVSPEPDIVGTRTC